MERNKEKLISLIKEHSFIPHPEIIYAYLETEDRIYVVYNTYYVKELDGFSKNRNVWCFDKETGKRLWVIEQERGDDVNSYSGVLIDKDGILKAHAIGGFDYDLDAETGKISNAVFTK